MKSKDIGGGKSNGFRVVYLWDEATSTVTIVQCYAKPQKTKSISSEINKLSKEYALDRAARDAGQTPDQVPSDVSTEEESV